MIRILGRRCYTQSEGLLQSGLTCPFYLGPYQPAFRSKRFRAYMCESISGRFKEAMHLVTYCQCKERKPFCVISFTRKETLSCTARVFLLELFFSNCLLLCGFITFGLRETPGCLVEGQRVLFFACTKDNLPLRVFTWKHVPNRRRNKDYAIFGTSLLEF